MKRSGIAAASPEEKRQSLAEWRQMMARYPLDSPWDLAAPAASALAGNGLTAWLVASGRMTPLELVILVLLEALLLSAVLWGQLAPVPPAARPRNPAPLHQRIATLAFGAFWIAAVYGIVFGFFVPQGDGLRNMLADPLAFVADSNLRWPLLIALSGAIIDARRDRAHFIAHGGSFLSTPGFNAGARWLTLLLGGVPFAVPLFALVLTTNFVVRKTGSWMRSRHGASHDTAALVATLLVPFLALAALAAFGSMMAAGVSAWAVGYCCAKFAAELFVVCIPLIALQAHAQEGAALGAEPGSSGL